MVKGMKINFKKFLSLFCAVFLALSCVTTAFAHSGRTDSSGGHKDNKNKSGLGYYHYHCGGYPAHLHTYGYCPYRSVFPSSVKVTAEKKTLGIGEIVSISGSVYPSNSCDTSITWSSSDSSVVSVSGGYIEAKGYGTATITAESFNGKKGTIKITVKEITADKVSVSGLPEDQNFFIGEEYQLDATITPSNVDNPSIVWKSSDEAIVSITDKGKVKLLSAGTVTITATASNGVYGSCKILVQEVIAESLTLSGNNTLVIGESMVLTAQFTPADTSDQTIVWSIDDAQIAHMMKDGTIIAKNVGTATIHAKQKDVEAFFEIEVLPIDVESITIESDIDTDAKNKIKIGDTASFSAIIFPENATYQDITWSTSNPEVATIDENGVLTALKAGKIKVIATSVDEVYSEYELQITNPIVVIGAITSTGLVGAVTAVVAVKKKKK